MATTGMKRSAAVAELESQLREMIGPSGGLVETRWVGRLLELMKETENTEGRNYLLKVLLNTPQTDKATLSRFIQLNGIELLGGWIREHKKTPSQEDEQVLHSVLSCLNKLAITMELLERTEIGKVVNSLCKASEPSIAAKASSIISKWKKLLSTPTEERKMLPKKPKETRVALPSKKIKLDSLPLEPEEVYVPPPVPEPIEPKFHRIRWLPEDTLESVKYFLRHDEPNAKCASLRPPEEMLDENYPRISNVDEFRRKEVQMERELNRKEKEREDNIKGLLENMTPRLNYTTLTTQRVSKSIRASSDGGEREEESRRVQGVQKISYQRESEIPKYPREPPQIPKYYSALTLSTQQVPLFQPGKQVKVIDITETKPDIASLYKLLQAQPKAPAPVIPPQPSVLGISASPVMPSSMPGIAGMPVMPGMSAMPGMTGMPVMPGIPGMSGMPVMPGMPGMPGMLGMPGISAPYGAMNFGSMGEANPYLMNPGMYDPSMMQGMMDPNFLTNRKRIIFNPVTKKPHNYRTVPCRMYHSAEGCPRGDNCHFIHDFKHSGKSIPNFQEWKNSNEVRKRNIEAMKHTNSQLGVATYYPPAGPETHDPSARKP